jgi:hypothetical protein
MKNLHPDIIRNIEESQKNGGIQLDKLAAGTRIEAQTRNTLYRIKVLEDGRFEIHGGTYFPEPTIGGISGSTWGGSMIKGKWLGVDMHMELWHPSGDHGRITTTAVRSLKVLAHDGSWEYTLDVPSEGL